MNKAGHMEEVRHLTTGEVEGWRCQPFRRSSSVSGNVERAKALGGVACVQTDRSASVVYIRMTERKRVVYFFGKKSRAEGRSGAGWVIAPHGDESKTSSCSSAMQRANAFVCDIPSSGDSRRCHRSSQMGVAVEVPD